MRFFVLSLVFLTLTSCAVFQPENFTTEALREELLTLDRNPISLQEVLNKNKGKKKFIQVFATYCPVSQDSFDDVLVFQKKNPKIEYIFLSVDHSYFDWKRELENIPVKGQHYYIPKKGEGALGKFLKLKTIPRFLVLDETGKITVFKSSKVSEKLENHVQ
ncbi:TlpA family protein disulfide reductase [Tenacibaculum caenipelagi]|uniref:Thioredoxin-like protein n=1 Tax=Tenacibaculum caenipelagi TaxID=1325435 RepID=A0A4R6TL47_9FLAO|nr:thioredoxin-like domain-containing protein [Tenacibaculum caenipelagi]TDQ30124.1 thioredoxin-like protein [Tenacibaculum caenipelagi]